MLLWYLCQDMVNQKVKSCWNLVEATAGITKSVMLITGDSPRIVTPSNQDTMDPAEFPTPAEAKGRSLVVYNNNPRGTLPQDKRRKGSVFDGLTPGSCSRGTSQEEIKHISEDGNEKMQFKRGCFDSLMTRRRNNNQSRRKRIAARIQANLGRIVQNHDPKSTQLSLKNSFSALGHWNALATGEYEPKKPFQGRQTNGRRNQRFHGNYITRAMNHCTNQHHKSPGKEGERSEDAIHSCRMVRCLRSNLEPSSHRSEEDQGNNVQPDARTHDDLPHEATVNKYHKTPGYQKKEGEDVVYTC